MSHNYYRIVGKMSILSVEVIGIESQKRHVHFYGGRGNKSTSETKHDTKCKYKIIYTVQRLSEVKIHNNGSTVVGNV